ncbi:hypothetical protein BOW53_05085 [Solemya pervernicosa gill symbiont]|uniref:Cyclic diguanosine monophosphate-binding protein n=2 Tax=Gammaproteobacteria incertae sedis TaxID=118884 RepID=A0A1T2L7L9_9GAMM|nr:PilZ domain-containing protein [Candidatus Reidiella endopervernicosa]OOZ41105.1 hypothetical protein BOW53_05085 [Solemya pervernicosa gill symbiont]QKQ26269.1 PilZ domain-containing protein [Candidatus Reidiella endopervernicosa]
MSDQASNDQRQFSRIPFKAEVTLKGASGEGRSELLDISLKGALIACPSGWQTKLGEQFSLELQLDGDSTTICMDTTVAHLSEKIIGLHCEHIDVESITHLRRLIELNLGNPDLLDRELAALSA